MNGRSDGMKNWLIQRVTAVYIALFALYLAFFFITAESLDYVQWSDWVGQIQNKVIISLFFFSLLMHAWIGIRDVIMDYVHNVSVRFVLLTAIIASLIAMAIWLILIVQGV